jgi:hypothetical protein
MSIEQLCCVCFGIILQTLTFALGIAMGASLRRKEPSVETCKSRAAGSQCPR